MERHGKHRDRDDRDCDDDDRDHNFFDGHFDFDIDLDFDKGGRSGRGWDIDIDVDIEIETGRKGKDLDIEIDVERKGKWLDVEIEVGSLDIEFKLDGRSLQPDTTPMAAMIGGDGTAIGEDTLVDANIFSRLIDLGSVTIGFGTAVFNSAAVSGDGTAFASATTFADIAGADFVFIFNKTLSVDGSNCDVPYATEYSTTTFIAIDFEDFDFAEGPLTFDFYDLYGYLEGGCQSCGGRKVPNLDGNVALLDADVQALAQNTLADVLASVLTLEDQLSTVSAMAVSAVG
jgi:hypothetical protein